MRPLVEDAGDALYAGWLCRFTRATGLKDGVLLVGGREVQWEVDDTDGVTITHRPSRRNQKSVRYRVGLLYTELPSGGLRCWWSCPECSARIDSLYLPRDRDRMACRKCCGLLYRSQYPGSGARGPKKLRPALGVTSVISRSVWTPAAGWVITSRRTVRQ